MDTNEKDTKPKESGEKKEKEIFHHPDTGEVISKRYNIK